jgi:hypothetical protein
MPDVVDKAAEDTTDKAQEYKPGELGPAIVTSSTIYKPDDLKKLSPTLEGVITGLLDSIGNQDIAPRRLNILQVWEARLFDRGYQYLDGGRDGWSMAGSKAEGDKGNPIKRMDDSNLYPTNVMASQGDIISSALCRGDIKVNFTPVRSKEPADVESSDAANKYRYIWQEANCSTALQRELAGLSWTDPRGVFWTRSMANKSLFGTVDTGTEDEEMKIVEVTTLHGVLESNLPIMADSKDQMAWAQIREEVDYAVARASYPWMPKGKIKPSSGTYGELEFERIARIHSRIGAAGRSLTGTTGIRSVSMGYNWLRQGMYYDDKVDDASCELLLEHFPNGLFVIMAGNDLVCCWDESMDDHLAVGVFCRGFGQNRRALGSSDIPINKRINIWADLWDKFIRGAIAMTLLDDQAFDVDAIAKMEATTTRFIGVTVNTDQQQTLQSVVGQTPVPAPVAGFLEIFQQYIGPLIQSIDGGTPALFGGAEGEDNTVGATQIRLQQALERHGNTWSVMNSMFAEALKQAAICCAENGNADVYGNGEGVGEVVVSPSSLKGNFKAKAETAAMIPQSGAQREARVLAALDFASKDPQAADMIASPSNIREIVKALHIDDVITVDAADAEDKQLEEIEVLLESEPLLNPDYASLEKEAQAKDQDHEHVKGLATKAVQSGQQLPPEVVQQGQQMEDHIGQLQDQLKNTPKYLPSVPVAQDASEDHSTEAATLFSWMQTPAGRKLRRESYKASEGSPTWNKWTNITLHWTSHCTMRDKLAADKQQLTPPKVSLSGKLAGEEITKLLALAGVQSDGQSGTGPKPVENEVEEIQRGPYSERKTTTKNRL